MTSPYPTWSQTYHQRRHAKEDVEDATTTLPEQGGDP
jgi:hypothetical protein